MPVMRAPLATRIAAALCGSLAILAVSAANAACVQDAALKGVNLAGAEFNGRKVPGVLNKDYVYPKRAEIDYFAAFGANVIRLPFRWERIQPSLSGPLDPDELRRIEQTVALARERGMCVILDVHNYGAYHDKPIGSREVPVQAFIGLWTRLAATFGDATSVAFGLMNEPFRLPIAQWAATAQQTVDAIRASGAEHLILVSGGRWSGVHEWKKLKGGTSNANAFAYFKDPMKRTWIEVHQYADPGYSGTGRECVRPARFAQMFERLTDWAKANDQRLFLGEFGTPSNPSCLVALDAILAQMKDETVWRGWAYWAAGSWLGTYPLSTSPRNGRDAPQMGILRKYFRNPGLSACATGSTAWRSGAARLAHLHAGDLEERR